MRRLLGTAVAIDIDGVLLRGSSVISGASESLLKLHKNNIPHIFLTNGGGMSEEEKSIQLTNKLNVNIRKEQIILSHTPMRDLTSRFSKSRLLVLGNDKCLSVATEYGFLDVVSSQHLHYESPSIYNRRTPREFVGHVAKNIDAVMIFDDPLEWALEMQILSDLFISKQEQIPFFVSNSDIVYMSSHPLPRYTQGAFILAFKSMFEQYSGKTLKFINYGKPYPIQYLYAEKVLQMEAALLGVPKPEFFIGIGDNPASDIRGANSAGPHWKSILVRTGVFNGIDDEIADSADIVCDDFTAAVNHILYGVP